MKSMFLDVFAVPDTGWRCCICYELAQVDCCNSKMCVKHAKEFNHGYGKIISQMTKKVKKKR